MIKIFKWIIEYQDDAKEILKNYVSYIQICVEKIKNSATEQDTMDTARKFLENDLNKLEILKNQINKEKKEKNCEEKNGGDNGVEADMDIDNKSEKEENDKEMMEKMEEILEKNKISAKQLQLYYP